MDPNALFFFSEVLERETKRFIATVLGELEAFTGKKDRRISNLVKDSANGSKRVILHRASGAEVESAHEE